MSGTQSVGRSVPVAVAPAATAVTDQCPLAPGSDGPADGAGGPEDI